MVVLKILLKYGLVSSTFKVKSKGVGPVGRKFLLAEVILKSAAIGDLSS
jgi:hypothetical protein